MYCLLSPIQLKERLISVPGHQMSGTDKIQAMFPLQETARIGFT